MIEMSQSQSQQLSLSETETNSKSQIAFRNLTETCKTNATLILYKKALRAYMRFLHLEKDQYDKLLDKDPKFIQEDVIGFISHMSVCLKLAEDAFKIEWKNYR